MNEARWSFDGETFRHLQTGYEIRLCGAALNHDTAFRLVANIVKSPPILVPNADVWDLVLFMAELVSESHKAVAQ